LQLCFGTGTGPGEQFGRDNLDAFLLREPDVVNGHPAEIMDEIGGLCVVPPTGKFDLEAKGLQRCPRPFNLDLSASLRQGEGKRAINENLHLGAQWPPTPISTPPHLSCRLSGSSNILSIINAFGTDAATRMRICQ
jgi:hypothetical protein